MNRDEAQRIAGAISIIRPDWLASSLVTVLGKLPPHLRARPARDVHLALAWLAHDPDQRTPRLLSESGPWWQLATQPGNAPVLLRWQDPYADTKPADPETIAAIRAARKESA